MSYKISLFQYKKAILAKNHLCKISWHKFEKNFSTELHRHDYAEMFWGVEGKGIHYLNGVEHNITTGTLYLLRPNDYHAIRASSDSRYFFNNLMFPRQMVEDLCERYNSCILREWCTDNPQKPFEISLPKLLQSQINLALSDVYSQMDNRLAVEYFLLHLIYELEKIQQLTLQNCPVWLMQACRQIESTQNFRQGIQVFSKLSGYSLDYVSRKIKETTGKTPSDILNDMRLNHAAFQLISTMKEISTISMECGFSSLSYFYNIFTEKYQMTPRRYRLKYHR